MIIEYIIFGLTLYFGMVYSHTNRKVINSGGVGMQLERNFYVNFVEIGTYIGQIATLIFGFMNFDWYIPILSYFGLAFIYGYITGAITGNRFYLATYPHFGAVSILLSVSIWFL